MNLDRLPVRSRKLKIWFGRMDSLGNRAKIIFFPTLQNENTRGKIAFLKDEIHELSNVCGSLRLTQ